MIEKDPKGTSLYVAPYLVNRHTNTGRKDDSGSAPLFYSAHVKILNRKR